MTSKLRLGVVFGGQSVEHEVSVVSAMEMLQAADAARFETVPFGVTRTGRWLTPAETRDQLDRPDALFEKRMEADVAPLLERSDVLDALRDVDAVFPLVHGINGEDGTLQGMLEMFGIPYAGCGVTGSAIGMDKALQKELFIRAGLNVAKHITVFEGEWTVEAEAISRDIESTLGYPAFVKPSNGGSSLGVSKVRSREDLGDAMREAFDLDRKVVVEEAIHMREVECGVMGNDLIETSPIGEIVTTGEFYDYSAKYLDDSASLVAPAELPEGIAEQLQHDAVRAFKAIDGAGFARVDFFLTPEGTPLVNEINTLPGFRPVSMFPLLWAKAGVAYRELISRIVDLALERFARDAKRGRIAKGARMPEARTPGKWPYRAAKPGRGRRVVKTREPEQHGVQRREQAAPRAVITPGQARLVVFAAVLSAILAGCWWAYHSPWLTVQNVTVTGTVALTPDQVRTAADLDGQSTFALDVDGARARVAALPKVRSVTVTKQGWNAVTIDLEERVPWGSWQINGVNVPIDIDGYVLDTQAPPESPLIVEIEPKRAINIGDRMDSGAVQLAARLTRESQATFGRSVLALVYKQDSGLTTVLSGSDTDDKPLWATFGDSRDYDYKVAALYVLIEQARQADVALNAVDLRFGDRLTFR